LNVRLGFESKHGFPSENKYLYVRSGILLIGYSDFDDSDFDYDYANYQVDIKISSDFFMLDYFQAIRTLRINNSNSRINTYL
jgi:hypothetical protein